MILRVDIDRGLEARTSRRVTDRIKCFEAPDWLHAFALISTWVGTLKPPPITILIDDRSDLMGKP